MPNSDPNSSNQNNPNGSGSNGSGSGSGSANTGGSGSGSSGSGSGSGGSGSGSNGSGSGSNGSGSGGNTSGSGGSGGDSSNQPSSQSIIIRKSIATIQCKILDNSYKIMLLSQLVARDYNADNLASLKQAQADAISLQQQLQQTSVELVQAQNAEITSMYSKHQQKVLNDYNTYQQKVGSLLNDPKGLAKYVQQFAKDQAQSNLDFSNEVRDYWLNTNNSIQQDNIMVNDEQLKLMNYYPSASAQIASGKITSEAGLNDQIFGDPTMVNNLKIDGQEVTLLAPISTAEGKTLSVDKNGIVHDADGNIIAATVSTQADGKTSQSVTVGPIDGKPLNNDNYMLTKVTPDSKTVTKVINSMTITKDITADKSPTVTVDGTPDVDTVTVGGLNGDMDANNLVNASFTNVEKLVIAQSTTMQAPTVMDFSDGVVVNPGVTLNLINFTPVSDLSKISGNEVDLNLNSDTNVTLSQASDEVNVASGKIELSSFDKSKDKIHFTNKTSQAASGKIALQSGDDKNGASGGTTGGEEAPKVEVNIDANGVATTSDASLNAQGLADALYGASNFSGYAMVKDGTLGAYIISKTASKSDDKGGAAGGGAGGADKAPSDASIVHIIGVDPNELDLGMIIN